MNGALGCGSHGVEAEQRAGRHDDLAAMRPGEVDQMRPRQQRAGAQHHHALAGRQHRGADRLQHGGRARIRARDRRGGESPQGSTSGQEIASAASQAAALAVSRDAAQASVSPGMPAASRRATARPMAPSPAMPTLVSVILPASRRYPSKRRSYAARAPRGKCGKRRLDRESRAGPMVKEIFGGKHVQDHHDRARGLVRPCGSGDRHGANLSEPADHHDHPVRGRRPDRYSRPLGRTAHGRGAGSADRHRECRRRRRHDRVAARRPVAARRLYHRARHGGHACAEPDALQAAALQCGDRFHPGGADRRNPDRADRAQGPAGQ